MNTSLRSHGIAWPPIRRALAAVLAATICAICLWMPRPEAAAGSTESKSWLADIKESQSLYYGWPKDRKPELALLLSGQVMGYLQPCGCSSPQYGGLERRFNFVKHLHEVRGWPTVAVDVGDLIQSPSPQALIKYRYSMEAMRRIGYAAAGIGKNEISVSFLDLLAEYALNQPSPPVVCANIDNAQANLPDVLRPKPWVVVTPPSGKSRVGIVGAVSPSVAKAPGGNVKFDDFKKVVPDALKQVKGQGAEILVLLLNGTKEEATEAAKIFPDFSVILCLTREEEPPSQPRVEGKTQIIEVGHKGRTIGVLAFFSGNGNSNRWDVHYEGVRLGPEYETPSGKDADNPVLALYDAYALEVKNQNYLAQYSKMPHAIQQVPQYQAAKYVGSQECKGCHKPSYKIWEESPHSHAYPTLVDAKRPALRQYDGECVKCHVIGFEYDTGFVDEKKTPRLLNNGCENCHGPGSLHAKNERAGQTDAQLNALMNPYRTKPRETADEKKARMLKVNISCQKCHDQDNDVHWDIEKWVKGKIEHHEPGLHPDEQAK
jgi:Cytochrome c554 and c-prime